VRVAIAGLLVEIMLIHHHPFDKKSQIIGNTYVLTAAMFVKVPVRARELMESPKLTGTKLQSH
jgi:hypothetical protein